VVTRSRAHIVFDSSSTGNMDFESRSRHGYLCPRFCVALFCVGRGHAMGRSPHPKSHNEMSIRIHSFNVDSNSEQTGGTNAWNVQASKQASNLSKGGHHYVEDI
jgi:hypothetical protein